MIKKKKWTVFSRKTNNIIDQILTNRGIKPENRDVFLCPDYERDTYNPFLLTGMKKAVEIILLAIKRKEKIGIFADYDADGIPGAAILARTFRFLGTKFETYIPSREEGYGMNKAGVKELFKNKCRIIITVDLGITGKRDVKLAKKLGMKVIVTDHHEIQPKSFPNKADVILHPNLSKKYPNKNLAGGAVAWKLSQAIVSKISKSKLQIKNKFQITNSKAQNFIKWQLDLVGISTICDMVSLVGENRVLAKYGLIVLPKTKNLGLQSLYNIVGIKPEDIGPYQVGWQIGPRINAPGRLDHASASYYLLTTDNKQLAIKLAKELNQINNERQSKLEEVLQEAITKVEVEKLYKKKIIIIKGKKWPHGIIGLVAARLVEKYHLPAIVFEDLGAELRGSARSISKSDRSQCVFNIMNAMESVKKYLVIFGGHRAAAGLTVKKENFDKMNNALCKYAHKKLKNRDLIKEIKIDLKLDPKQTNLKLVDQLKKLEPHGIGNPRPVFLIKKLVISELRLVGKGEKHLKLKLKDSNNESSIMNYELNAIRFCEGNCENLKVGDKIDIVCNIEENIWQDTRKVDLKIVDLRKIDVIK